ncbi:MAG: hypothetical protein KatS3mg009_2205 [Acidimicrobiia bacterium]|nr:MAG: hypothetical protein KatS3mg009_2205 [Acidimicrobiia bacterium]
MTPRAVLAAGLVVAAAGLVACDGGSGADRGAPGTAAPTTPTTAGAGAHLAARPYRYELRTETFVDPGRPARRADGTVVAPERTLVTDVYVPRGEGPFPVIAFAHGLAGHPRKFRAQLLARWAEAGYVVAAPAFPLTNDEAPTVDAGAYADQPADLVFVLDRVLATVPQADAGRVGVAGFSLGTSTALAVGFNTCCRDPRVDAVGAFSTLRPPFDGEYEFSGRPLLLVHGTGDPALPYSGTAELYALAAPPKFLFGLDDATHAPPFEDAPSPHDELVGALTVEFWDAYLLGDAGARERLARTRPGGGLARVEVTP